MPEKTNPIDEAIMLAMYSAAADRLAAGVFARLVANIRKGHWLGCSEEYLLSKLSEEFYEVVSAHAYLDVWHSEKVDRELYDIAAAAMILLTRRDPKFCALWEPILPRMDEEKE